MSAVSVEVARQPSCAACCVTPVLVVSFTQETLSPVLDHSKPLVGLLCHLVPLFLPDAERLEVLFAAPHPVYPLSKFVAHTTD